jgi:hypothetical protein
VPAPPPVVHSLLELLNCLSAAADDGRVPRAGGEEYECVVHVVAQARGAPQRSMRVPMVMASG